MIHPITENLQKKWFPVKNHYKNQWETLVLDQRFLIIHTRQKILILVMYEHVWIQTGIFLRKQETIYSLQQVAQYVHLFYGILLKKKKEIKHSRPKNDFQFFVPGDHPVCSCVSLVSFLTVYIRCLKKVKAGTAPWAKGSHPQTWDQRPSRAKASPSVATSEWVSLMMYQQYIHPTDISERQDMILKHHSLGCSRNFQTNPMIHGSGHQLQQVKSPACQTGFGHICLASIQMRH